MISRLPLGIASFRSRIAELPVLPQRPIGKHEVDHASETTGPERTNSALAKLPQHLTSVYDDTVALRFGALLAKAAPLGVQK
jgi:hypothetical protein